MRSPSSVSVPVLLVLATLTAACGGRGDDDGRRRVASGDSVRQGPLTPEERAIFYHLAEGSELIPLSWIKALRNPHDRSKFFLENPERLGLIADPTNADGLPIGVTAATTVDSRLLGVIMMGFNCSACHVNEITYQGNRLRIDGGPSRFNTDTLGAELKLAIHETLKPLHLIQFMLDVVSHRPTVSGTATVPFRHTRHPAVRQWLHGLVDRHRTALDSTFLASLDRELRADLAQNPPVNLHNVSWDSTDPGFQQLMRRYSHIRTQGLRARLHQMLPRNDALARDAHAAAARIGALNEILSTVRRLHDWLLVLESRAGKGPHLDIDITPNGPGRVDAFGVARNRLYPEGPVDNTAPVSYPHLWGFAQNDWLHYDANTTSVMERNLGQALGVGGSFDPVTLRSTLNPYNLHRLELLARRLEEPAWPSFFPPIDQAKARQGAPLFGRYCAGCHLDPPQGDTCYSVAQVGTDSLRVVNFAAALGNGRFTDSVAPLLRKMKYASYDVFKVPPDQREKLNEIPDDSVVWRVTGQYGVRTLRGVWATAPYLHNGSVPSLYELLLPAGRRSATFPIGHPEYDPVKVGYSMTAPPGTAHFDTSLPGNANTGHEYGTDLSEAERMALLEYLKTLGAYSGTVTPQPGGGKCPNLNGPPR